MRKTVQYKGDKIKVEFTKINFTRVVDKQMPNGRIIEAHGTKDFIINNKTYQVEWTMKFKTTFSTRLHFEGYTCGDSEKKMIEHILEKYGL